MLARVGAGGGFGQPEAADRFAGGHLRQPLLFLFLGAVLVDGAHGQRALHRDEGAQAGVAGFEFGGGQAVFHGGAAGAAVALQVHAEQAELGHLGHDLQREYGVLVPAGDVRLDRAVHKGADVVPQRELGITEQRIEVDQIGFGGQVEPLRSEHGFRLDGGRLLPR